MRTQHWPFPIGNKPHQSRNVEALQRKAVQQQRRNARKAKRDMWSTDNEAML